MGRGTSPPARRPPRPQSLYRICGILAGVHARARQGNASASNALAFASPEVQRGVALAALRAVGAPAPAPAPAPAAGAVAMGDPPARVRPLLARLREFVEGRVAPAERALEEHARGDERWTIHPRMEELKEEARSRGLWNLWISPGLAEEMARGVPELAGGGGAGAGGGGGAGELWGGPLGAGLSNYEYAFCAEVMGRYGHASEACNCSAPDTGNMEVLGRYGSPDQKREWLAPLLRGEIRSCFGMTEPDVASSDATNVRGTIALEGASAVVTGRKWWTSGAMDPRCRVCLFMGKSDPGAPRHRQQSVVIVPMGTPGVRVVRPLLVFGFDDAPHGHAEVEFSGARVPASNVVLGPGRGFEIAQGRLGPGRLHHCMRLVGAGDRALGLAAERANEREAFGGPLARQGGLKQSLARARVRLEAARLLVLRAASAIDAAGAKAARLAVASAKVAAPEACLAAVDLAIQIHGACGVCEDTPLAWLWAQARTLRIADGPDEVHLETLARDALRPRL